MKARAKKVRPKLKEQRKMSDALPPENQQAPIRLPDPPAGMMRVTKTSCIIAKVDAGASTGLLAVIKQEGVV